ncbi:MAG: CPBP family intramembrane metalloprotease [Alphaproteobacteria bacterium]|nr:CPBP family intramembrane metalloprotease [Alphaproteobacteria bacterium]
MTAPVAPPPVAPPPVDWTAATPAPTRWRLTWKHGLAVIVGMLALVPMGGFLFVWIPSRTWGALSPAALHLLGIFIHAAASVAAVYLVGIKFFRFDWAAFGVAAARAGAYWWAIGLWILLLPLLAMILYVTREITGATPLEAQLAWLPHGSLDDWRVLVLLGLAMVVAAPIGEELLFRGVIFGTLRRTVGFWPSALLSAAAFGSAHMILAAIPPAFVLGVALAWMYERAGSIRPPIAVHVIHNALVFLGLVAAQLAGV